MTTGERQRPRRPGRPRSERAEQAILRAACELLHEVGLRGMTVDGIARRAGVSKATVYKWWPNKSTVAIDAFLSALETGATRPATDSARDDLAHEVHSVARFYTSPTGGVFAQLIAEAQTHPDLTAEFRDRYITVRRERIRAIWRRGVERGELRADVDPEIAIDLLFGPLFYRLLGGHAPLDQASVDAVVDAALRGLASGGR